jgi:hypothetical protein
MEARFDDQGVAGRAFFRTARLTWPEVSEFTDGAAHMGEETVRALKIVLRDGRTVSAGATMRAPMRKGRDSLRVVLATIGQVVEHYQIPAQLTRKVSRIPRGDTPIRRHGSGGSLPGPDSGHPRQGMAGHDVRSTRGALPVFLLVGFPESPPEPGVPVIPAPGSPQVPLWVAVMGHPLAGHGAGMAVPR